MAELIDIGQELDLTLRQGATFGPITCTYKDEGGTGIDITGATVRAQIRKEASKRKASGIAATTVLTDAVNGVFTFEFSDEDTATLVAGDTINDPASQYVWDMEIELTGGQVIPFCYGVVKVFREVTKDN